jgi:hypothetical protein
MRVHFGLGKIANIEYLEVRWPSGLLERFRDPRVDSIFTATEGLGEVVVPANETLPKSK